MSQIRLCNTYCHTIRSYILFQLEIIGQQNMTPRYTQSVVQCVCTAVSSVGTVSWLHSGTPSRRPCPFVWRRTKCTRRTMPEAMSTLKTKVSSISAIFTWDSTGWCTLSTTLNVWDPDCATCISASRLVVSRTFLNDLFSRDTFSLYISNKPNKREATRAL